MAYDRFIRLLTKSLSDQLTDAEREEFIQLLQDNKEYRDQKAILEEYWKQDRAQYAVNAAMFKKVQDKISTGAGGKTPYPRPAQDYPGEQFPRSNTPRIARYSAAASILLALAGIYFIIHKHRTPSLIDSQPIAVHWQQKTTQPTVKTTIILPDSSVITLNSATTLKYPDNFRNGTREVYLDGEAYFDVAKDPAHPFIIHANRMNIKVLGTAFNIKSYPNEQMSEATLIKGSIEVTLNDRPSDRITLKPKEKLIVQNNILIKKANDLAHRDSSAKDTRYSLTNLTYFRNNARTVVETSWVENKLVFSDKDFEQLSGQLERWYGVHIEFANEKIKEYRFTGFFEKETLPQALDVLRMIEHFNYRIKDSTVYIF
jgi:ferric-dicitrate binding protein FerR (iron transport regulator)